MKSCKAGLTAITLIATLGLAGCGGGGANLQATTTTMGQELQDLDAAYQKGLMTESEYKRAREEILKRYK